MRLADGGGACANGSEVFQRVSFAGGKPKVIDGPFAEVKEVLGGYWMIEVRSKEEAIEWAKRCPGADNEVIEIRQVQELGDWPADYQALVRDGGYLGAWPWSFKGVDAFGSVDRVGGARSSAPDVDR